MIEVLRLGHRRKRDERLTTHVCLVARAFGADRVVVSERDEDLERTVGDVTRRFGGPFEVVTGISWRAHLKAFRGPKVHLTMYGLRVSDVIDEVRAAVRKGKGLLIVVGSEKVPGDVYKLVDFNVAVGNQPHSEAAALAILLERLTGGDWEKRTFEGGEMEIIPTAHGKGVRKS